MYEVKEQLCLITMIALMCTKNAQLMKYQQLKN